MERFEWIKEELGCHTDAECVRILVNDFYKSLKEREGRPLILGTAITEREPTPNLHPTTPRKISETLKKFVEDENR